MQYEEAPRARKRDIVAARIGSLVRTSAGSNSGRPARGSDSAMHMPTVTSGEVTNGH